MIKELRIGNLVNHKDDRLTGDHSTILHLDEDEENSKINYIGADNYKPIPLTEEWLSERYTKESGRESYLYCIGGITYTFWDNHLRNNKGKAIKFVHTLQNIWYFDKLTGEELEIKE